MSLLNRLDRIPLSRPHYALLLMGGLGYTFDGMDAAIVAFLLPSVRTEWGLSTAQLGIIGSATPFGFLFGAVIAGFLGDRIGRRSVMLYALIFYCIFTLVAAAAPNYAVFVGARVLAGLGTGAESAIIAPFLAEFVPPARRGWFLGALAGFFSFGFVGAALIGRFVVPLSDAGWRWAQVLTALPVLMVLWWRRSLPESPRYLLLRGRTAEAEQVVADFERRAEASLGTARRLRAPVRLHAGGVPDLGAQHRHRHVQRLRAHRQHHRSGDHRDLRGRARLRRGLHDDHGRPPGRGRGRADIRSVDRRSVAGGAQRAARAGRRRVPVMLLRHAGMGMMSRWE